MKQALYPFTQTARVYWILNLTNETSNRKNENAVMNKTRDNGILICGRDEIFLGY